MRSYDDFDPGLRQFHPEFGYLCPPRQIRHGVRLALLAATFGVLVGAIGATLLLGRPVREPARMETALTLDPLSPVVAPLPPMAGPQSAETSIDGASATPPIVESPAPAKEESAPAAIGEPPPARSARLAKTSPVTKTTPAAKATPVDKTKPVESSSGKPCEEETWPYFDRQCLWGPVNKEENERPAAEAPAPTATPAQAAAVDAAAAVSERRTAVPRKKAKAVARARREAPEPRNVYAQRSRSSYARDPRSAYANFGFWGNAYARSSEPRRDWRGWSW